MRIRSELKIADRSADCVQKNSFKDATWIRADPFSWVDQEPFPDLFEWITRSLRARMNDTQKENRV